MINYALPPSPDLACKEPPYAFRSFAFSNDEIHRINEIGEYGLRLEQAKVGTGDNSRCDLEVRNSKVSWLPLNSDTQFIYDRIGHIARELNGQFFQLDLFGFVELIQYTVYEGSLEIAPGHYTWHMDKGIANAAPRKLSLVIQLSDPSEYEGGHLEIFTGPEPEKLKKQQGMIYAFPSYTMHRVTPVTGGVRRTLVVWLSGPKFK